MKNVFEDVWILLLNELFESGENAEKDDARIKEVIGVHKWIPSPYKNSPVNVTSDVFINSVKKGFFDIEDYPLNGEALYNYVNSLNDLKQIYLDDDGFVYTYSERLMNYPIPSMNINQIDVILNRLDENINSNRAVAVTYSPLIDYNRVDIPCLQIVQCLVRNNELILVVFFRSNDLYGAFPSNMMFLTYLGLRFAEKLNVKFKGVDYHCSSLHIYETDLTMAKSVIE